MNKSIIFIILGCLVVANIYSLKKLDEMENRLLKQPEIVSIDMAHLLMQSTSIDSDSKEIESRAKDINEAARRLSEAGYIVLHQHSILSAPDEIKMTYEDISKIVE